MTLRYLKSCDSWMACASQGTKGEVGIESADERRTLYQYIFYGSIKVAEPFSDSSKILDGKGGKLIDVKELKGKNVVFEFLEDTYVWGFNPNVQPRSDSGEFDASVTDIDWTGRLITENSLKVSKKSILVCLDGSPVVNGKTLSRYNYDELSTSKTYTIDLKTDGVLALFTQI